MSILAYRGSVNIIILLFILEHSLFVSFSSLSLMLLDTKLILTGITISFKSLFWMEKIPWKNLFSYKYYYYVPNSSHYKLIYDF
jgi:hypothetical protein